jgi:hypothetical protein
MHLLKNSACKLRALTIALLFITGPLCAVEWKEIKVEQGSVNALVVLEFDIGKITYSTAQVPLTSTQQSIFQELQDKITASTAAYYGPTSSLPYPGIRWVETIKGKVFANLTSLYEPFSGVTTTFTIQAKVPDTATSLTEEDWLSLEKLLKDSWNTPGLLLQQKALKKPYRLSDTKITSPYVQPKKPNKATRP